MLSLQKKRKRQAKSLQILTKISCYPISWKFLKRNKFQRTQLKYFSLTQICRRKVMKSVMFSKLKGPLNRSKNRHLTRAKKMLAISQLLIKNGTLRRVKLNQITIFMRKVATHQAKLSCNLSQVLSMTTTKERQEVFLLC
jgi:hypothetical protein